MYFELLRFSQIWYRLMNFFKLEATSPAINYGNNDNPNFVNFEQFGMYQYTSQTGVQVWFYDGDLPSTNCWDELNCKLSSSASLPLSQIGDTESEHLAETHEFSQEGGLGVPSLKSNDNTQQTSGTSNNTTLDTLDALCQKSQRYLNDPDGIQMVPKGHEDGQKYTFSSDQDMNQLVDDLFPDIA